MTPALRLQWLESRGLMPLVRRVVAAHPGVEVGDIFGASRLAYVVEARAHLAYELYDLLRSYPAVGRAIGRDHSTVMYLRRKWANLVGDDGPAKPAIPSPPTQQPYRHPSTVYAGGGQ